MQLYSRDKFFLRITHDQQEFWCDWFSIEIADYIPDTSRLAMWTGIRIQWGKPEVPFGAYRHRWSYIIERIDFMELTIRQEYYGI